MLNLKTYALSPSLYATLFYDTIYAYQDAEDDALIGVKSTARLFGDTPRPWLRGFMVGTCLLMTLAIILSLGTGNVLALALALGAPWAMGWHMAWQLGRFDAYDPQVCLRLFRSNRNAGLLAALFLAIAAVL